MSPAVSSTDVRVVLVTAPSEDDAADIARTVLEERLVACVNIVPGVRSIYRFEGKVFDEREALLIMKTSVDCTDALVARVRALHTYTVPEVIALDVVTGSAPYLDWVFAETRPLAATERTR